MNRSVASMYSRVVSVVFGSFYLCALAASYLLALFYPFFAPYGLLLIPTIANFCIGYFVGDLYTVVKIIVVIFSLQAGVLLALHYFFLASDVFFGVTTIFSYYSLEVPMGIVMSFVGIGVREESSNIIALCMHLAKELKQIIKRLLGKV
jgi:hypothetical protein